MTQTDVPPAATSERIRAGHPVHFEIVEFLEDEASLLDRFRLMEWYKLLTPDIVYRLPVRQTRMRDNPEDQFASGMFHFDEDASTLFIKSARLETTASPWAENPVSRTRRFITNIKVFRTDSGSEYRVTSSVLLVRSRYDDEHLQSLGAERRDLVRRTEDGLRLARRDILVDQSTVGLANFAVFL